MRDVAKAFGLPSDQIALLASCYGWGNAGTGMEQRLAEAGFDPDNPLIVRVLTSREKKIDYRIEHLFGVGDDQFLRSMSSLLPPAPGTLP